MWFKVYCHFHFFNIQNTVQLWKTVTNIIEIKDSSNNSYEKTRTKEKVKQTLYTNVAYTPKPLWDIKGKQILDTAL